MNMHKVGRRALVLALVVVVLVAVLSGAGIAGAFFANFEMVALGTTSESIALDGATLASGFRPGDWTIQDAGGDYGLLSGHILKGNVCDAALTIHFDETASDIEFLYGADPSVAVVKVDGWLGTPGPGTLVFSQSHYGANYGSPVGMREGAVSILGSSFDYIVIYAPGGCLAIDDLGTADLPGPDMLPIPATATGATITRPTPAYWAPDKGAASPWMLPAGTTVWALGPDEGGAFYQVIYAGAYLWVPADSIGPNYDSLWGGTPLPLDPVE